MAILANPWCDKFSISVVFERSMETIKDDAGHELSNKTTGAVYNGQPQQSDHSITNTTEQPSDDEGTMITKVIDILSENSSAAAQWKTALSGSLDEKRLLFGLVVLSIFYLVYINVNSYQNDNNRDEHTITHNCTCRSDHRSFYLAWSAFCFFVWTLIHIILAIPQIKTYCCLQVQKKFRKNEQFNQDKALCCNLSCGCIQTSSTNQTRDLVCSKSIPFSKQMLHSKYWCTKLDRVCAYLCCNSLGSYATKHVDKKSCYSNFIMSCIKLKRAAYQHNAIHRYEYYLWTKYYELYVVGIAKDDEKFNLKSIDKFISDALDTQDVTDGSKEKKPPRSGKEEPERAEAAIYTALSHIQKECFSYGVQATMHLFLFLVLFLAQLAVIPLLMIQVFDTYAFLCFAADNYCTTESQFSLHFHQTVVTFAFYCSLMVSFLASTMLRWVPWPKKDSHQNEAYISTS